MGVDALDAGHAEPVEVVPDPRRARHRVEQRALVGRVIGHERLREDGVVAVVHGLDLHEERVVLGAAVVAGELAERPLELLRIRGDDTLHHDLGARRIVEARRLPLHDLDGSAEHRADEIQLGDRLGEGLRGRDEERGIDAPAAHDLARLVAAPVPLDVQPRVLARREVEPDLVLALHHLAVAADVEPAPVRVARDDRVAGPDVLATVPRPVARRGEVADVHLVVAQVVLVHGRALALHDHGRDRAGELGLAPLDQLHHGEPRRLADGEGEPVHARTQRIPERAEALGRALDALEEEGGRADLLMGHVGDRAHLLVAAHFFADPLELADGLDARDPVAQVSRTGAGRARAGLGRAGDAGCARCAAHLVHGGLPPPRA